MSISAIILTKNEEKNIVDCLESVSWCDEKVVIDDNSEDNTVDLAERHGAVVYSISLNNNFSKQRNFGLSKTNSEWALFVDADERISDALAFEISNVIHLTSFGSIQCKRLGQTPNGFYIKRNDHMWGKELRYGETGNIKLVRLAKKGTGHWLGRVHEKWKIEGEIGELKNSIQHYPHQTIEAFLKEINFYTNLRAEDLYKQGVKSNWALIILYPKIKFFKNYFIKLGFLDGIEGFVFAMLMSLHSFLVRGKLWLLWQKR